MISAIIRSMRPKQWAKNVLIFTALIFDTQLTHLIPLLRTLAGFCLFSLLASAVYILNDISDLDADRQHPKKRLRPIASGRLPLPIAWVIFAILLVIVFPLAYWLSPFFAVLSLGYFVLNVSYSKWFKHIPVLDVVVLASFYVLRVGLGVSIITVQRFSPWLYLATTFGALFLGVAKRRAELTLLAENANSHRRALAGYSLPYLDQLITIVVTLTIITYSLYTFSAPDLPPDHSMMLTIPFVLFGIFRYLYLVQTQQSGGAPEEVFFTDRPLQITLVAWAFVILYIFYVDL